MSLYVHYDQGGYIIWALILKLEEHLGSQKLRQVSIDIIYIYMSKHQEMNINTMLQSESIDILCRASHVSKIV